MGDFCVFVAFCSCYYFVFHAYLFRIRHFYLHLFYSGICDRCLYFYVQIISSTLFTDFSLVLCALIYVYVLPLVFEFYVFAIISIRFISLLNFLHIDRMYMLTILSVYFSIILSYFIIILVLHF